MRNSRISLAITTLFLAGTIGTFSVFAHEGEGEGMQGMDGMMGMMNMMSEMDPEDRKAMTQACMNMMQSHGDDQMDSDKEGRADAS